MSKPRVHIVSYTHWDREFRWEFERTRMRLVDCLDHMFEILDEDKQFRSFMLDGQMTLLDDYLEIRPEMRKKIEKYVKAGRLEIGPWFTLPDCAPIHGESVVRNLAYGMRMAKELGGVMRCGYNVFSFGQIAQLPQLYANFGIDTIIFYKYMDPKRTKYPEFIWEAPDGTRAFASRLGREARWNFFFAGHVPIVYDKDPWHKDWQYRWGDLGKVFHTADPENYGWFYDILDPETSFFPANIREGMERTLKTVEGTAVPQSLLFFEGTDFTEPHPLTSQYLKEIRTQFADRYDVQHSTLMAYLAEMKAALKKRRDLDVVSGPMRDGPVGAIHTDVFTIHPEIPAENSHAENALLRWAEPLSAMAWVQGIERFPKTYLDKAWKLLFQSHAHDSMHGLGPATLAEGELARLRQAHVVGQGLVRRGLQNITKEIDTQKVSDSEYFLAVHNPSSFARSEVVEAFVDVPADVKLNYVIIEDLKGRPVSVQEVSRKTGRAGVYHPRSRNMPFYATKVHLYFHAADVPALGYKVFKLKWSQKNEYPYPHEDWDPPRILAEDMLTGPARAENDFVRLNVNPDGTLDILDKKARRVYAGLNYFMDQGDIGNMWMSETPGGDAMLNTIGIPAEVAVRAHGPLAVVFDIKMTWRLPAEFDWNRGKRSDARVDVPIHVSVTLRKDSPAVEVVTRLTNTARDHYLKVGFPTGLAADKTWSEGSFAVAEFPVRPSTNGELRGNELARHPAQLWFDTSDGKQGLAVLLDAAKDYEVLENDASTTMAMGLVRCVRLRIPCDNRLWMEYPGDESPQSLRAFEYRYALMPHAGTWDTAGIYDAALAFNTPLRACQFGRQEGSLPAAQHSFVSLTGANLVLSAITKTEERETILVRLYNPSSKKSKATMKLGFDVKSAWLATLAEERTQKLTVTRNTLTFDVPKGKIVTVEIDPK